MTTTAVNMFGLQINTKQQKIMAIQKYASQTYLQRMIENNQDPVILNAPSIQPKQKPK